MHTIRIEQILTLSKTQMHNIMRRTIDYNKPTNTIEMAEHFEKKEKRFRVNGTLIDNLFQIEWKIYCWYAWNDKIS